MEDGLYQRLMLQQKPLALMASDTHIRALTKPVVEAVNFARACQGSVQIIVTADFDANYVNHDSNEVTLKGSVTDLLKALEIEGEELAAEYDEVSKKVMKVTITASKR